jgi:hypothetical protein
MAHSIDILKLYTCNDCANIVNKYLMDKRKDYRKQLNEEFNKLFNSYINLPINPYIFNAECYVKMSCRLYNNDRLIITNHDELPKVFDHFRFDYKQQYTDMEYGYFNYIKNALNKKYTYYKLEDFQKDDKEKDEDDDNKVKISKRYMYSKPQKNKIYQKANINIKKSATSKTNIVYNKNHR